MRKLVAFSNITVDGYFAGTDGDISWTNKGTRDAEFDAFVAGNAKGGGVLVFGRVTYELMASYWPTPLAMQHDPVVAERMNSLQKLVFSRTLTEASWSNTKLVRGDMVVEVRKMKQQPGEDMAILGSGSIVSQLAQEGLVDEFQMVVDPVVLGQGMTLFDGIEGKLDLKLVTVRAFANGNVFLCYVPLA